MPWAIEFFEDDTGNQPVRDFLMSLDADKRSALIAAIELVLMPRGLEVCSTEFGRQLGQGLFEFRIRHEERVIRRKAAGSDKGDNPGSRSGSDVLLRVFCHAYGRKVVLLLGAYDKGDDPSPRRQAREIRQARKRLRSFGLKQQRRKAADRRRS